MKDDSNLNWFVSEKEENKTQCQNRSICIKCKKVAIIDKNEIHFFVVVTTAYMIIIFYFGHAHMRSYNNIATMNSEHTNCVQLYN